MHTCVSETFLEIGCDYGTTVARVQKALSEVDNVLRTPPMKIAPPTLDICNCSKYEGIVDHGQVSCLGIDKSTESISIASEQFPDCLFSVEDALTDIGAASIRDLCQ